MATVSAALDLTGLDKAAQLVALRRQMASILGRRDHAPTDLPDAIAPKPESAIEAVPVETVNSDPPLTAALRSPNHPAPTPLSELLPHGALARGTALSINGAGSVLVGLVASVSAAGHHVALIGNRNSGCSPHTSTGRTSHEWQ